MDTRDAVRSESLYQKKARLAEQSSQNSACQRQQQALRHQLTDEPATPRPQGSAQGKFLASSKRTIERKPGNIRTGNQQNHAHGAEQEQQRPMRIRHRLLRQRYDLRERAVP